MCSSIFLLEYRYIRTLCDSNMPKDVLEAASVKMEAMQMTDDR